MISDYIKHSAFILAAASLFSLGACSDNNDFLIDKLEDKTFTSSNGLELYYNGVEMPGKTVKFTKTASGATITGYSDFDLSQLSALGLSGELPCPGIIPGEVETVWNVSLKETKDAMTFSGHSSSSLCSYSYSGEVTDKTLKIFITDAMLDSHPLSENTWKPAPIQKNEDGIITSIPMYIDWKVDPTSNIDIDLSGLLQSLTTLPIIPVYNNTAYMSVSTALDQVVKAMAFRADGNILFTYISTTGGAAHLAQTMPNGLQYTIPSEGKISLFVNPLSLFGFILENTSGSTPPDEVDLTGTGLFPSGKPSSGTTSSLVSILKESPMTAAMLKGMMTQILPHLATGIQLDYTLEGDRLNIFIDTRTSLTLLNTLIETFLQNDAAVKELVLELEKDSALAPLLEDLPTLRAKVEEALLSTTTFRLGFSFVKA